MPRLPQSLDFGVDDPELSAELNFSCVCIVVDNFTNQYLHILGNYDDFIPPYTTRAIYVSTGASRVAQARFEAPIGLTQAPKIAGQSANIEFHTDPLPPSTGTTLTPFAEQELVGTLSQGGFLGALKTGTFDIPPGTHAIGLLAQNSADWGDLIQNTQLQGVQSTAFYVNQNIDLEAGLTFVPLASGIDSQVTLVIPTGTVRAGAKLFILAIKDVQALQIYGGIPFVHGLLVDRGQGDAPGDTWLITRPWAVGKAPYDGFGLTEATGAACTMTVAAVAGKRWVANHCAGAMVSTAAVALGTTLQLQDGATAIWGSRLGLQAIANLSVAVVADDLAFIGGVNTSMSLKILNSAANIAESVALGAHRF